MVDFIFNHLKTGTENEINFTKSQIFVVILDDIDSRE